MRSLRISVFSALVLSCLICFPAHADFAVGAWNLQSGGSDDNYLASTISQWPGYAVWGFSEVQDNKTLTTMCQGLNAGNPNARFAGVLGTTGRADRLAIAVDQTLLKFIRSYELHDINVGGTIRAPLVAQLQEIATGKEFLFVVNHFYRGKKPDEVRREQQSQLLRDWAAKQVLPVISVGDFNFDCKVPGLTQCNSAFNVLMEQNIFQWIIPQNPMRTQCNHRYPAAILDFVFVSGPAKQWKGVSWILNTEKEACRDDDKKADHRPVAAKFDTTH